MGPEVEPEEMHHGSAFVGTIKRGVIELFGVIGASLKVPVYSQILDDVRRNRRFRALIVEIDSPGGPPQARSSCTTAFSGSLGRNPWLPTSGAPALQEGTMSPARPIKSWPSPLPWLGPSG